MADAILCDEILVRLEEVDGAVTVQSDSAVREALGLNDAWSKTQVKKALGSLVRRRYIRRIRSEAQGICDDERPTTFRLVR